MLKSNLFVLIFLILITGLQAAEPPEYELVSFSSARERTEAQILTETGMSAAQLQGFSCENPARTKLFSINNAPNQLKTSLKVSNKKMVLTYQNQNLYTQEGDLYQERDKFFNITLKTLRAIEKTAVGKILVEEMQKSSKEVFIAFGGPRFAPSYQGQNLSHYMNNSTFVQNLAVLKPLVDGLLFDEIGSGGRVFWTPKMDAKFVESDNKKRKPTPEIILGHELFHAYDAVRGVLDRRFLFSDNIESNEVSEIRAVYFENLLRKQLGLKYRKFYSEPKDINSKKDLLENGEPLFIPAPCIEWID